VKPSGHSPSPLLADPLPLPLPLPYMLPEPEPLMPVYSLQCAPDQPS